MPIALGISRHCIEILDLQLRIERQENITIKLQLVVYDNCLGDSKPTHNIFPHELWDIFVLDDSISFCFYLFAKIICCHK